jgi:hypothetical protein
MYKLFVILGCVRLLATGCGYGQLKTINQPTTTIQKQQIQVASSTKVQSSSSTPETNVPADFSGNVVYQDDRYAIMLHEPGDMIINYIGRAGDFKYQEIWLLNKKTGEAYPLIQTQDNQDGAKVIINIHNILMSPDKTRIYYLSSAYTTSDYIHYIDLNTGGDYGLCGSSYLEIIKEGKYKGGLIIQPHQYYTDKKGSYDNFYIADKDCNRLVDLGEDYNPF